MLFSFCILLKYIAKSGAIGRITLIALCSPYISGRSETLRMPIGPRHLQEITKKQNHFQMSFGILSDFMLFVNCFINDLALVLTIFACVLYKKRIFRIYDFLLP